MKKVKRYRLKFVIFTAVKKSLYIAWACFRNATYFSAGNDGSAFAMSGNQINVNAALDYGTKNSFTLTVRATDGASNTGDVDATVTISLNTSKNRKY